MHCENGCSSWRLRELHRLPASQPAISRCRIGMRFETPGGPIWLTVFLLRRDGGYSRAECLDLPQKLKAL